MGARIDETKLIGEVYDRLKIVKTYREGKHIMCDCDCVCGGHKSHIIFSLKRWIYKVMWMSSKRNC